MDVTLRMISVSFIVLCCCWSYICSSGGFVASWSWISEFMFKFVLFVFQFFFISYMCCLKFLNIYRALIQVSCVHYLEYCWMNRLCLLRWCFPSKIVDVLGSDFTCNFSKLNIVCGLILGHLDILSLNFVYFINYVYEKFKLNI